VLQVALKLDPGGAERLIVDLARGIPGPGWESMVCCLDAPGAWAREVQDAGLQVVALGREPGFQPGLARRLARLAHDQRIDVLHCHQYTPYVYGALAKLLRPSLRLVFTEHGRLSDAPPSGKRKLVNPWIARIPGARYAVCEELRGFLIQEGFPADRIGVIYNGISLGPEPSGDDRAAARELLGVAPDRFVIGTVARLDPVKDHATLLRAFSRIRSRHPEALLVLVGDGDERVKLEAIAQQEDIGAHLRFLGNRDDARRLLPGLDLYVNCSRYEGVSLTIVEAMAARLPVIATEVGGTPEVVEPGRTGVLVPPGDADALADGLTSLMADPRGRERFAAEARRVAEERFDFQRMLEQYRAAYAG
jgi:glycosyltransferase involved in cell wall biosynthesis